MRMRKPILRFKDAEGLDVNGFKYKNTFVGYIAGVSFEIETDLSKKDFDRFLDVGLTGEQIEKFEMTGKF